QRTPPGRCAVIPTLTWSIVAVCTVLMVLSGWYAYRDRLLNDVLLGLILLVELGTLVQAVRGLTTMGAIADGDERATFAAYLLTLPVVPVGTGFLALKEKTRWAMGAVAVGAFAVAVMALRCQQIWDLHG
ncbi:MAG TPA: hypothetical protein PLX71_11455, partial [Phycicoccus sp.]|nr:hypothetical protein [Phycicoccus sp.]